MKPEKAQNFENEKSEEVKKDLLSEEDLEKVSGGYEIIHHDRPDDWKYWDSAGQEISFEELKKRKEANR